MLKRYSGKGRKVIAEFNPSKVKEYLKENFNSVKLIGGMLYGKKKI